MTQQVDGCNIQVQLKLKNSHEDREFEDSIKEIVGKRVSGSNDDVKFIPPTSATTEDPDEVRASGNWGYVLNREDKGFLAGFSSDLSTSESTLLLFYVENNNTSIDDSMRQMTDFMNACIVVGKDVSIDYLEIVTYSESLANSSVAVALLDRARIPSCIKTDNPERFRVEYSGDIENEDLNITVRYENGLNQETNSRVLATSMSLRHRDNKARMASFINDGNAARLAEELVSKLR